MKIEIKGMRDVHSFLLLVQHQCQSCISVAIPSLLLHREPAANAFGWVATSCISRVILAQVTSASVNEVELRRT